MNDKTTQKKDVKQPVPMNWSQPAPRFATLVLVLCLAAAGSLGLLFYGGM